MINWYSWTGSGWNAGNDPFAHPDPDAYPVAQRHVRAPGSTAAITDAAGNRWTISSSNTVLENGQPAASTGNVAEIAYVDKTVWTENTANQWYSWTGSGWNAGVIPCRSPRQPPHQRLPRIQHRRQHLPLPVKR